MEGVRWVSGEFSWCLDLLEFNIWLLRLLFPNTQKGYQPSCLRSSINQVLEFSDDGNAKKVMGLSLHDRQTYTSYIMVI